MYHRQLENIRFKLFWSAVWKCYAAMHKCVEKWQCTLSSKLGAQPTYSAWTNPRFSNALPTLFLHWHSWILLASVSLKEPPNRCRWQQQSPILFGQFHLLIKPKHRLINLSI